eukprot:m.22926 g.22926  ORF g.22926 m.22926 type:complete len:317 (-) comp8913_c0_seq1:521-1471(-)
MEKKETATTCSSSHGNVLKASTPLHQAALKGMVRVVKVLAQRSGSIDAQNETGYTALQIASFKGFDDIVDVLLEAGANVNQQDLDQDGFTALHLAAQEGHISIAKRLLMESADPNLQNDMGDTPLHITVRNANLNMCKLLLQAGANLSIEDEEGKKPGDECQCDEIGQLLEKYGGEYTPTPSMNASFLNNSNYTSILDTMVDKEVHELRVKLVRAEQTVLIAQKEVRRIRERTDAELKEKNQIIAELLAKVQALESRQGCLSRSSDICCDQHEKKDSFITDDNDHKQTLDEVVHVNTARDRSDPINNALETSSLMI